MTTNYDFIIIGSGPSGLTLSYILGNLGKKCLLVDKNNNVGGCHRVLRVDGLFTEHGPRIYSNSYVNTIQILKKMGINFYDIFTEYNFSISTIGGKSLSNLKFREIFLLSLQFLINSSKNKNVSMDEFMTKHNFSSNSRDYINRLCLLTDGASSDKYTLFEFLELANQQLLYKLF
jgi:UDP-galactopyranose mutase